MTDKAMRVFLCDDQGEIRDALRAVIGSLPGFTVMGEAASGPECLQALEAEPTDLVVLDVSLPGGGPPLAAALREHHPTTIIVVFSGHSEPEVEEAMREAGAHDYVVKTGRLAPLRSALLRHVAPSN